LSENENVALRLSRAARLTPTALAICQPLGPPRADGNRSYDAITFEQLDRQTDNLARGLLDWGCQPGMKMVLAVPFGAQFIQLTFALLKAGLVPVLVDPGMGRKHLVQCLQDVAPDGFVAVPRAQLIRRLLARRFPKAKWNVTVGRRWLWGGETLAGIERRGSAAIELPARHGDDVAAIIFTTGSTGPPKGVQYTHDIFNHQIDLIRTRYEIRPGSRDLACFPLFGLFDSMMGVTTIIPDMDPTRPADVDPRRIFEAVQQWEIDQAFGSPALWNTVARWCNETGNHLTSLRRILSAGAPVPPSVLQSLRNVVHPEAEIFTPYGATESLPIASIESREILQETAAASRTGRGTCVGTRFPQIHWRVIQIDDGPLDSIDQTKPVEPGQIGELMVQGPVVTDRYVTRVDQNRLHKVADGDRFWHRMGDLGYLDSQDRFWFCGRKSHRVVTPQGTLFTVPCESIFNTHDDVYRSALVGMGSGENRKPVIVVEPVPSRRAMDAAAWNKLCGELRQLAQANPLTASIADFRLYPDRLPVDIRHNSKIFREQIARWVQQTDGDKAGDGPNRRKTAQR
jgi:acyl-CoA synthetase (AMP-forming)/AMP-acid ligase II